MLYNMNTCVYWGAVFPLLQAQMSCSKSALADFVLQNSMEPNEGSFWEAWCKSISLQLWHALESGWSCSLYCWGPIVPNMMKSLAVFCWPCQTGCLSCSYPSFCSPCKWGEMAKVPVCDVSAHCSYCLCQRCVHPSEFCETDNRKLLPHFQNMWKCKVRPCSSEDVSCLHVRNRRLFFRPLLFWQSWLKLANGFRSYWRRGNL